MLQTLYICGDSFCTSDPKYGPSWVELLKERHTDIQIINLASPGASNYLIYKQVEYALSQPCDYLIYHATSSIRQEFSLTSSNISGDNINRYWSPYDQKNKTMICAPWSAPWGNTLSLDGKVEQLFSSDDLKVIKEFFTKFIDFNVLIEKNYIFIKATLDLIVSNKKLKNWIWSQGGFQHKNFNNFNNDDFKLDFSNYKKHQSTINLWDEYDAEQWRISRRPYHHITDLHIIQNLCNYYADVLQLKHDANQI
jgi:hypothetical protein